jgi:hypothetical protein
MPARNFGTYAMFGIALMLEIAGTTPGRADCIPGNLATPAPRDPVARVLAAQRTCPKDAIGFVEALEQLGARMEPTAVNFVGFHNPDPGAFFIFEIVSTTAASPSTFKIDRGDLLFGLRNGYQQRSACFQPGRAHHRADCLGPGQAVLQFLRAGRRQLVLSRRLQEYSGRCTVVASPAERV